jgi:hypothetical protein
VFDIEMILLLTPLLEKQPVEGELLAPLPGERGWGEGETIIDL